MVRRAASLGSAGLRPEARAERARLFRRAARALAGAGAGEAPSAFFVPGRIEVLGKHTDYCGGRSLLCALEQGFSFVSRSRTDRFVRVFEAGSGDVAECELSPTLEPRRRHWSNYPATVARRVSRNFPQAATGVDIAFASDLPSASGMSSSSALTIGTFLAIAEANHLDETPEFHCEIPGPEALAGYLATIENGRSFGSLVGDQGVGTFGGSEDHTAILCCQPGILSQYRFAP
ncbi:MAG: galactokinase, partial [Acidobacteria bacterium]|nr:galactokinase [Acidobacteriota bacterium]